MLVVVQFQGDSSAASYGGAGGAAGAIDEDDDGKQCTGVALTLQVSVSLFRVLCFISRSCAVSLFDALLKWCRHLFRPWLACCTQRYIASNQKRKLLQMHLCNPSQTV